MFCFLGAQIIKEGVPTNDELEHLSRKIEKWKSLARRLQLLTKDILEIERDNDMFSEKVFSMLMAWKRREGSYATYRVLYDALRHPLVNRRDVAEELCRPFLVGT